MLDLIQNSQNSGAQTHRKKTFSCAKPEEKHRIETSHGWFTTSSVCSSNRRNAGGLCCDVTLLSPLLLRQETGESEQNGGKEEETAGTSAVIRQ